MKPDKVKTMRGFGHLASKANKELFDPGYLFDVLRSVAEGTSEPPIEHHATRKGQYTLPPDRLGFAYALLETMGLIQIGENVAVDQQYWMTGYGRDLFDRLNATSKPSSKA